MLPQKLLDLDGFRKAVEYFHVSGPEKQQWTDAAHIGAGRDRGAHFLIKVLPNRMNSTRGLVVLYVPEGTEDVYQPGETRGRLICAVQLIRMPPDRRIEDYYYDDWDGSRRWPLGWPARMICSPPEAECPCLRDHVEALFGPGSYSGYTSRFQHGPFPLEANMRERINRDFAEFPPFR
jgi:hypothetical protein